MKSLLIALSMVSVFCVVGCSGGDGDTEPIKPSANASGGTANEPARGTDPNQNITNVGNGNANGGSGQPVGEVKSSTITKN